MIVPGSLSHVRRQVSRSYALPLVLALLLSWVAGAATQEQPIRLHPENPHYFLWRGKPTVLVASTEHYGAVLNADFDYRRYLDELKGKGLNYTRLFSGVYCEPWGEPFNTLNPPQGRYLTPWARSDTPGYADGGNKFDLSRWDDVYFSRLRDFLQEARQRGVITELTLFCNWYDDGQWRLSPLHINNNTNNVGRLDFKVVNTLRSGDVLKHQEAMVRKIVSEVNGFDNLFFEICNEPGADGGWMDHMAQLVYEAESSLPKRHLIANNEHATPHLSILNAHYDRDGSFVRKNHGRNIVIGYDETGFDSANDYPYRRQGWNFLLSGGGLYDNLDWSFSVAHPDGTETKWDKNLGGGSPALRQQLGILHAFLDSIDLVQMEPDKSVIAGGVPGSAVALAEQGRQYAIYLDGGQQANLSLALPAGTWRAEWVNTKTGQVDKSEDFQHDGGPRTLASPAYNEDIALRLRHTASSRNQGGSALRVSDGGRYLVQPDGKPFFWLGDTAWLLSQMTTREDADLYLRTRAQQGFTVIQAAIVMGEERVGGTLRPNVYGAPAFSHDDPSSPLITPGNDPAQAQQYDYWDHVDYIIERAAAHGLTLGLLPLFVGWRGDGYKYLTPERAYGYGLFLGQRYRDQPHILWILGGDNTPDTEAKQKVWHELARGIAVGVAGTEDYSRTLMTYHINGGNSSSQWFHQAPWLDFNMIQVWGDEKGIYPKIMQDYQLTPVKPTGLGEGSYEDGPQYPTRPIDACKIRKQAYWSYLAGGYHTSGNTNTWNFSSYKDEGTQDWKTALQSPGAAHLSVLAKFFASLAWWKLIPDPALFAEGSGRGETLNAAMRSAAGDRLLVYLSAPVTFSLHLDALSAAPMARAVWIDPRTGTRSLGEKFPATGVRSFSTPPDWPDALLLIETQSDSD